MYRYIILAHILKQCAKLCANKRTTCMRVVCVWTNIRTFIHKRHTHMSFVRSFIHTHSTRTRLFVHTCSTCSFVHSHTTQHTHTWRRPDVHHTSSFLSYAHTWTPIGIDGRLQGETGPGSFKQKTSTRKYFCELTYQIEPHWWKTSGRDRPRQL